MKVTAIAISAMLMVASLSGCESRDEAQIKQLGKDMVESNRAKLQDARKELHASPSEKSQ